MEYPQRVQSETTCVQSISLNPCSNGISSKSTIPEAMAAFNGVLILVLMEYPQRAVRRLQDVRGFCVLILVLMEYPQRGRPGPPWSG